MTVLMSLSQGDFSLASASRAYGGGEDHAQAVARSERTMNTFLFCVK